MRVEAVRMSSEEDSERGKETFLRTYRNHLDVLSSFMSCLELFCACVTSIKRDETSKNRHRTARAILAV